MCLLINSSYLLRRLVPWQGKEFVVPRWTRATVTMAVKTAKFILSTVKERKQHWPSNVFKINLAGMMNSSTSLCYSVTIDIWYYHYYLYIETNTQGWWKLNFCNNWVSHFSFSIFAFYYSCKVWQHFQLFLMTTHI